jgi:hypothetical protein
MFGKDLEGEMTNVNPMTTDELTALCARADDSLPAYPGDTERLMTVPAPTMLRLLATIDALREEVDRMKVATHLAAADCQDAMTEAKTAKARVARLRSSTWTDYIEADAHNEIVRDLQARVAQLEALLDRSAEWPHDFLNCLLDGDYNADKGCVSCKFNREVDAALLDTCSCTVTRHERQENRACPVHFPRAATEPMSTVQPVGNCDGSGKYAYDASKEDGRGAKLATKCPGCRACR